MKKVYTILCVLSVSIVFLITGMVYPAIYNTMNVKGEGDPPSGPEPEIFVTDYYYNLISTIDIYHHVYVVGHGFTPHDELDLYIVPSTIAEGSSLAAADVRGDPELIIIKMTGTFGPINLFGPANSIANYLVVVDMDDGGAYNPNSDVTTSLTVTQITSEKEVIATDYYGDYVGWLDKNDDVYVKGNGFTANQYVDIYLIEDSYALEENTILYDISGDGVETEQCDGSGALGNTLVSNGLNEDITLDICVDANQDGLYNSYDDVVSEGFGITKGEGYSRAYYTENLVQLTCREVNKQIQAADDFYNKRDTLIIQSPWMGDPYAHVDVYIYTESMTPVQDQAPLKYEAGSSELRYVATKDAYLDSCGNLKPGVEFYLWSTIWGYAVIGTNYNVIIDYDRDGLYDKGVSGEMKDGMYTHPTYNKRSVPASQGRFGFVVFGDGYEPSSGRGVVTEVQWSENFNNLISDGLQTDIYLQADASDYDLEVDLSNIDSNFDSEDVYYHSWGIDGEDNDDDSLIDEWDEQGIYQVHYMISSDNNKADGEYTIGYTFTDESQQTYQDSINVKLDNTVPSSSITDPDDQDIVDGNVEIKIQSDTDAMWATAYYYYDENENSEPDDGTDWVTIGNERYSTSDENNRGFTFDWDTTNLDDGEYLIKTKTYDRALNMDLDSISVTVDNS